MRKETDSLGVVMVEKDRLWGAQTQRSLEHFSIGSDLIPIEQIHAYGILKEAAAIANNKLGLLDDAKRDIIVKIAKEISTGKLDEQFPLHVWMTGSGTQSNMNVNEVIANRASKLSGNPLGSHSPVHPNDHVNMSQSSNDSFPSAMHIAIATQTVKHLLPAVEKMRVGLDKKAKQWESIVKIGRTHMQDATPLTLGQAFSGYVTMLNENISRIQHALQDVYHLALGGTAVGTGLNTHPDFSKQATKEIARLTKLPFVSAPNKFAVQGSHDALVMLSGAFRVLAVSLFKIASDIRLLSCGPRCGLNELNIPANEPGSSIMPGKVNPTQCEAMTMVAAQVMGNDVAVGIAGSGGILEMQVFKPLLIKNLLHSCSIMSDSCTNFTRFLVDGMEPNEKKIKYYVENSLMLVTALSPVIGYDKASQIAHYAHDHDLSLKQACLDLGFLDGDRFDEIVDPAKMTSPSQTT